MTDTLDNLFNIASEAELIEFFGKENVIYDTVYGAEGEESMATILFPKSPDQVEIAWKNEEERKGVGSITHYAFYDNENDRLINSSRWKTASGISLGTTLTMLNELNGKPFIFTGFGWDYGGTITNWQGGNLENFNMSVHIGISDFLNESANNDYNTLMGDIEFKSDNPVAIRLNPTVITIELWTNE